jgi:hypothetical protein
MKLVGLMPVRSESWCLGLTARAALMWCDMLLIVNHASTDNSAAIARQVSQEHPGRVKIGHVMEADWNEMQHRQSMLDLGRQWGGTHFAIVDADEIVTGNLIEKEPGGSRSRIAPNGGPPGPGQLLQLPGYNLRHGIQEYHSNGVWGSRWFSTAFQDDPRLNWSGDRFHHREPMGMPLQPYRPVKQGDGGVMHLWGSSERRLIAKHRMYRIQERLRWPKKPVAEIEKMYSWATHGDPSNPAYGTPQTWTYSAVPESWWAPYKHLMHHLDLEQVPWQEAWCDEMIETHGREWFAGLNVSGAV